MGGERQRRRLREPAYHSDEVRRPAESDTAGIGSGLWSAGRVLQFAFWYVLFWTGLAFFFASQIYFLDRGRVPWTIALSFSAPRWYSWGLFAPGVFWVDKRLGTGRSLAGEIGCEIC